MFLNAADRGTPTELSEIATKRKNSIFLKDMEKYRSRIQESVAGKRILAIGAAGSIGSATVSTLADFGPVALHIVDHNENELAELVRTLRSRVQGLEIEDFRTLPLDFGSMAMRLFVNDQSPYDLVLNFAAIKHVRSEKDTFSMLQMFETNFLKQARLLRWLKEVDFRGRYFSVSTDKAANPSSFMGASKRLMEHVMFSGEAIDGLEAEIVSARFANVAFSNGSLLQSFQRRIAQNQPLAVPVDTRRYFVSMEEAGHLCSLAATCVPHGHIVVPKLNPDENLVLLESVARGYLTQLGLEPKIFSDETEARHAVAELRRKNMWPLLLTPLDTAGEKPYEEFVAQGETTFEVGFPNLSLVRYMGAEPGTVSALINAVEEIFRSENCRNVLDKLDKDALKNLVGTVEPEFLRTHKASNKSLDSRV